MTGSGTVTKGPTFTADVLAATWERAMYGSIHIVCESPVATRENPASSARRPHSAMSWMVRAGRTTPSCSIGSAYDRRSMIGLLIHPPRSR